VAEESAAQVALKLGANEARKLVAGIPILGFDEKGSQVFADNAVKQSLFRLVTLVANPSKDGAADSQQLLCGGREHRLPRSRACASRS
jgi:hypothetical protein